MYNPTKKSPAQEMENKLDVRLMKLGFWRAMTFVKIEDDGTALVRLVLSAEVVHYRTAKQLRRALDHAETVKEIGLGDVASEFHSALYSRPKAGELRSDEVEARFSGNALGLDPRQTTLLKGLSRGLGIPRSRRDADYVMAMHRAGLLNWDHDYAGQGWTLSRKGADWVENNGR